MENIKTTKDKDKDKEKKKKRKPPHKGRVEAVIPIDGHSALVTLKLSEPLSFLGGQYVIVNTKKEGAHGKPMKKALTILSSDRDQLTITLGVAKVGAGSSFIASMPAGHELEFGGPYGKFKPPVDLNPAHDITLIASETGINAALGLLNSQHMATYLDRCRVYWLLGEKNPYLNDNVVAELLPKGLKVFEKVAISSVRSPERLDDGHALAGRVLRRSPSGPIYLAGDGLLVDALKRRALGVGRLESMVFTEYFFDKPKAPDGPKKGMREGFTTGACAAAAAKAAARALVAFKPQERVTSTLPNGSRVTFEIHRCQLDAAGTKALCSIIKDGGDDPDVTHGAELVAEVVLTGSGEIELFGGVGVAVVTKPGLGLSVGGPAINPVPSMNIREMVAEELEGSRFTGAKVTISVPDGEERAKHTLNGRLGLLNGISILGTTGIVKPYSTAAFVASVVQGIELAKASQQDILVFTTGGRSETFAMKILPHLLETCFIQVGDYIGIGIRNAARQNIKTLHIVGMMGKLSKMADGKMMTHASKSEVNMPFLAQLAAKLGAERSVVAKIREANTARHVYEIAMEAQISGLPDAICEEVVAVCCRFARHPIAICVTMVDFSGGVIGKYWQ